MVPGGAEESVSQLVARAKELNSERVVLVAPGISEEAGGALVAAAVAGAICGEGDPALPLGGVELRGIPGLALRYGESELDTLLQGGVTPVELAGEMCIRDRCGDQGHWRGVRHPRLPGTGADDSGAADRPDGDSSLPAGAELVLHRADEQLSLIHI